MKENEILGKIIHAAIRVHTALGPGLLEHAYKECLYSALKNDGLIVEKKNLCPWFLKTLS